MAVYTWHEWGWRSMGENHEASAPHKELQATKEHWEWEKRLPREMTLTGYPITKRSSLKTNTQEILYRLSRLYTGIHKHRHVTQLAKKKKPFISKRARKGIWETLEGGSCTCATISLSSSVPQPCCVFMGLVLTLEPLEDSVLRLFQWLHPLLDYDAGISCCRT